MTGNRVDQINVPDSLRDLLRRVRALEATPQGSVDLLYEFTVTGSPQNSIDTNVDGPMAGLLPQTYSVLEVWASVRDTAAAINGLARFILNNDSGNNYAVIANQVQTSPPVNVPANAVAQANFAWNVPGSLGEANAFGMVRWTMPAYASTTEKKAGEGTGGSVSQTAADNIYKTLLFQWDQLAGVNQINLSAAGQLDVDSALYVYGRR